MNSPKTQNATQQLRAAWKFGLSFLKREWSIEDYPIHFRFQLGTKSHSSSRLILHPWIAQVINWPVLSGSGNTKLESLDDLRKNFEQQRSNRQKLPRPGTGLPIEFASQSRVDQHIELAEDFARRVLEKEWAWISDVSALWDFHGDETNNTLNAKVLEVYGVDVSDITSGNLADIFDRISEKTHRSTTPLSPS